MNDRPHESPDCRCDTCARHDNDVFEIGFYELSKRAYAAERAAWQALVDMCDEVFRDDSRDDA